MRELTKIEDRKGEVLGKNWGDEIFFEKGIAFSFAKCYNTIKCANMPMCIGV